jgi:hypothetical protein
VDWRGLGNRRTAELQDYRESCESEKQHQRESFYDNRVEQSVHDKDITKSHFLCLQGRLAIRYVNRRGAIR